MRLIWFTIFLIGTANIGNAETIRVLTGEHADFTRVVLRIPANANWEVGRVGADYGVRVSGADGFDLEGFFQLIPRDRIIEAEAVPSDDLLRLGIGCDCNAKAFLDRPDILVIDIADGPPNDNSPFEKQIVAQVTADTADYEILGNRLLPLIETDTVTFSSPNTENREPGPDVVADTVADDMASILSDLESAVIDSIEMGLGDASLDKNLQSAEIPLSNSPPKPAPGLRLTTGADQRSIGPRPGDAVTQSGSGCIPDHFVNVGEWGDDRSFAAQIAGARGEVGLESDRPNQEAFITLARRYVYFGFGREARQAMALRSTESREMQYLSAIAGIIDDLPNPPDLFAAQSSCRTQVALWAMLATEPSDATVNADAVLRGFAELPEHLKTVLAPRLADRFLEIGNKDAASQILDRQDNQTAPTAELMLSKAKLQHTLEGDSDTGFAKFIRDGQRIGPEVVISHFQNAADSDAILTSDDFILGDAIRFELAEEARAVDVAVAQFHAHLSQNDFAGARAILDEVAALSAPEQDKAMWNSYAQSAAEGMNDAAFLHFAFDIDASSLPMPTRADISDRLLLLNFDDRARSFAAGRADETSGLIRSPTPPRSDTARVENPTSGTTDVEHWRAGDWQSLTQSADPLLERAAQLALDETSSTLDAQRPLTTGRDRVKASNEARQLIEQLLLRFPSPSVPAAEGS